jgi:hypothetical protein
MRREFFKFVAAFPNSKASALIEAAKYPDFFQICKDLDPALYFRFLSSSFPPKKDTPEYSRFIFLLEKTQAIFALTTNVDEALEKRLPQIEVVQRSNLPRAVELVGSGRDFLAKIHGSSSRVEDCIFSQQDYQQLVADEGYLQILVQLFTAWSVVFLGYGVRDQYVLELLKKTDKAMSIFGSGPHFVVTNDSVSQFPTLRRISYSLKRYPDHRAAMSVLDYVWQAYQLREQDSASVDVKSPAQPVAYQS